jgi:hypothetical protein
MKDVTQIRVIPDRKNDADFVEWLEKWPRRSQARYWFLITVRTGIKHGQVTSDHSKYIHGERRRRKRGKDDDKHLTRQRGHILTNEGFRIALSRTEHSDILDRWLSLPKHMKSPMFIVYWRIGAEIGKTGMQDMPSMKRTRMPRAERTIIAPAITTGGADFAGFLSSIEDVEEEPFTMERDDD